MEFFRRILNLYRRWVAAFYRGPSWLWGNEVREGKYVSPTLALFLWFHGLCSRVFTFQGWVLFWVWLATAFYATVMLRSPVMILFLVLTGLFLLDGLLLLLLFPRLKVVRTVPGSVMPGRAFSIEYEVENLSFFPCFSILADPLLQGRGLKSDRPVFFSLPGKGKCRIVREFQLDKRGVWLLPAATVETAFPFGLFKASFCDHKRTRILAHPLWRKWDSSLFSGAGAERGSRAEKRRKRSFQRGLEPIGCREYVYGDEMRCIHWGNSAKWGKLVVKEFEEEKNSRLTVILDTALPFTWEDVFRAASHILRLHSAPFAERDRKFESVLSFASSLAASFSGEGQELVFYFPAAEETEGEKRSSSPGEGEKEGEKKESFRKRLLSVLGKTVRKKSSCVIRELFVGNRHMSPSAFLDELSAVEKVDRADRFDFVTQEVLEKIAENPPVLLVLLRLDKSAQLLYGKLAKAGIPCRVLLLSDGEKEKEKNASPLPVPAEKITEEALLAGRWMV
ncbi:MAG: DUF58 domain-containing protein [Lentisphaeria bacterium]|nr:DUF58 domain-containing protein [Lentisphaeria bacterium]